MTTTTTPENRQGFLMAHWDGERKTCPEPLRLYYGRANGASNSWHGHLIASGLIHACCLQVQQAESREDYHPWRWRQPMTEGLWYRNPPVLLPQGWGWLCSVFSTQASKFPWWEEALVFPVVICQTTHPLLYWLFPFPVSLIHSPFGFSFSSSNNLHTLQSLSASGKTNKTFTLCQIVCWVLHTSYLICCCLIINTLSFP